MIEQIEDTLADTVWRRRWFNPFGPRLAKVTSIKRSDLDGNVIGVVVRNAHHRDARVTYDMGRPTRRGWPHGYKPNAS